MSENKAATSCYTYPVEGWSNGDSREYIPKEIVETLNSAVMSEIIENWVFCDLDFIDKYKNVLPFACYESHFVIYPYEDGSGEILWRRGDSIFVSDAGILLGHVATD